MLLITKSAGILLRWAMMTNWRAEYRSFLIAPGTIERAAQRARLPSNDLISWCAQSDTTACLKRSSGIGVPELTKLLASDIDGQRPTRQGDED